jgi:hypothetical protein
MKVQVRKSRIHESVDLLIYDKNLQILSCEHQKNGILSTFYR